jgi:hypothetical protein
VAASAVLMSIGPALAGIERNNAAETASEMSNLVSVCILPPVGLIIVKMQQVTFNRFPGLTPCHRHNANRRD